MKKLSNDSTATIKGITYQFLVALDKCFELQEGETLYIETFGDVSILGNEAKQIEAKYYKGTLTNLDINIWKTINNWMRDEFPINNFKSLILLTTQNVRKSSLWYGWNDKSFSQRELVIKKIYKSFLRKNRKGEDISKLMAIIFEESNTARLENVISKFTIDHSTKSDIELFKSIKYKYAKGIPETRKDDFVKYLFGYITNPLAIENNSWSISYNGFTTENKRITLDLVETTTIFPAKISIDEISEEHYIDSLFIDKIKEINYYEVIPEAISDFVLTRVMIMNEFRSLPTRDDALDVYQEGIASTFRSKYRQRSRQCVDNEFDDSKSFLDEMMYHSHGSFYTFANVPTYFSSGVLHSLTDNKEEDYKWKLNVK